MCVHHYVALNCTCQKTSSIFEWKYEPLTHIIRRCLKRFLVDLFVIYMLYCRLKADAWLRQ